MPPTLKARIKTHKENNPIHPVINNIHTPSYKLSKFLSEKLQQLIQLPNIYTATNSTQVALDVSNLTIKDNHRLITPDIKNLFVNWPIDRITHTTENWLHYSNTDSNIAQQCIVLLCMVLNQNYYYFNNQY
jgi:hypothetical protein